MGGIFGRHRRRSPSHSSDSLHAPDVKRNEYGPITTKAATLATDSACCDKNVSGSRYEISPYVIGRWSSMYFDEDGDLAHEFYIEAHDVKGGSVLRKLDTSKMRLQGFVQYDIPRLNPRSPHILIDANGFNQY